MKKYLMLLLLSSCVLDTTPDVEGQEEELQICGAGRLVQEVQQRTQTTCRVASPNLWVCGNVWAEIIGRTGPTRLNTYAADVYWCPDQHGPCYFFYSEACDCTHCWGI